MKPDTEIGGPARAFPATSWTLLRRARDDRGGESFERLVRLYWKPVYGFLRRSGVASNEDAKDLAQDFFTRVIFDGALMERYDPAKGGFRPFLKAALRNFLSQARRDEGALKRGGDVLRFSFSGLDLEPCDERAPGPEEAFDRAWERAILARTLERLEERLRADGKEIYWKVFRAYELTEAPATYAEVGGALGLSGDTVKNHLTAARKAFLEAAKAVLAEETDTPEEFARELAAFLR